tara:strand:- start:616 stop:1791 length:1176 start_codon:yes stop_codon:yes gene_type:complete
MVQLFQQMPEQANPLGQSLGQGLGQFAQRGLGQQKQQQQAGILSRMLSGQGTPEEAAQLDPGAQLELAKMQYQAQNKAPLGGLSGQPVPPEFAEIAERVINDNPDATADQLLIAMDKAGLPRTYSDPFVETRRGTEEQTSKAETTKQETIRKETFPIKQAIAEKAEAARQGIQNKQNLSKIIDTGNLDDPTFVAFATSLPFKLGERLLSPETVEYRAGLIDEFKDLKTIFSGQTRNSELDILQKKMPDIYLNDTQKKGILKSRVNALKADIIREDAAAEVEEKFPNLGIFQFQKKVDELAKPQLDLLFDRIIEEHNFIFDQAEKRNSRPLDANDPEDVEIINQVIKGKGTTRLKVNPGTPVNNDIIAMYMRRTGDNVQEAEKMAREDGYEF